MVRMSNVFNMAWKATASHPCHFYISAFQLSELWHFLFYNIKIKTPPHTLALYISGPDIL